MKEEYLPQTLEGKLAHLIEECAEVIQAATKIQRFGWEGCYPDGTSNEEKLHQEIDDLNRAIIRLAKARINVPD